MSTFKYIAHSVQEAVPCMYQIHLINVLCIKLLILRLWLQFANISFLINVKRVNLIWYDKDAGSLIDAGFEFDFEPLCIVFM